MSRIPEATIQEIRSRADIVAVVSRYVDLKQAGRNWKGLCPFHDEKTPSFNVSPDRDMFHCFGCQAGGDVIGFVMKHEGLTFPEAARQLAGELGIEIPDDGGGADDGLASRIYEANELAQSLYRECLREPEAQAAQRYLVSRGFDGAAADAFGIGFAPARWDALTTRLRKARIPAPVGMQAGLLAERRSSQGHYDRLRGRVTFPIRDVRGRVVGFGGRAIEPGQEPKYLNTPETPVFRKRQAFYGFPDALEPIRRSGRVILCEGYFDQIAFVRAGLGEALATCGTALTAEHAEQLRRRTREVVLVFDGDEAGEQATDKALATLLPKGLRVRAVTIPGGGDPDDMLRSQGADALRSLVDEATDALELAIRNAVRQGASSPDQKADAVGRVAPLVALVADAVAREEYVRRLALAVDASPAAVASLVRSASRSREATPRADADALGLARARRDDPAERQLRELARLCLQRPDLFGDEIALKLHELLPEGSWKSIILQIIETAAEGGLHRGTDGANAGVDPNAVQSRLDDESARCLREIAIDDLPLDPERPPEHVLSQMIARFEERRLKAREREISRRLRDSSADPDRLIAERQALLAERRSRLSLGVAPLGPAGKSGSPS